MKNEICRIKDDNRGVALVYALVIGTVVMTFALMLLLVTYTLFTQASRQTTNIQCKLLAESFGQNLELQLEDTDSEMYKYIKASVYDPLTDTDMTESYWVPTNMKTELLPATYTTVKRMVLKDEPALGYYKIYLTLSYESYLADGEDNDLDTLEDDNELDKEGGLLPVPGLTPGPASPTGSVIVKARIKCSRGTADTGRDSQSYMLEREYKVDLD